MSKARSNAGNAVIFVLVGIALFAALSYSFMRTGKQGQGNFNAQNAKLRAQALMSYGASIETAVNKLRAKGCSESQLSFEPTPFDGSDTAYVNASSPSDQSCHIFSASGGRVSRALSDGNGDWYYLQKVRIYGLGDSSKPDLLALYTPVDYQTCITINAGLGLSTDGIPLQENDTNASQVTNKTFKGDLSSTSNATLDSNYINKQPKACGRFTDGDYFYYHAAIIR